MDYKILNLKKDSPTASVALANFLIELDVSKLDGTKIIKVIHGYGSHGVGGEICKELRALCFNLKKQKKIKDYLLGSEWTMENEKCFNILTKLKNHFDDEDLNNSNPGITIIVV